MSHAEKLTKEPPAILAGLQQILDAARITLLSEVSLRDVGKINDCAIMIPIKGGNNGSGYRQQKDIQNIINKVDLLRIGNNFVHKDFIIELAERHTLKEREIKGRPDILIIKPSSILNPDNIPGLSSQILMQWVEDMQAFIQNQQNWPNIESIVGASGSVRIIQALSNPVDKQKLLAPQPSKVLGHVIRSAIRACTADAEASETITLSYGSTNTASTLANALRSSVSLLAENTDPEVAEILQGLSFEVPSKSEQPAHRSTQLRISAPHLVQALTQLEISLGEEANIINPRLAGKRDTLVTSLSHEMFAAAKTCG